MRKVLLNLSALTLLIPAVSFALPITWEGNGHKYELVRQGGLTWDEANAAAQAAGGHLVTITSEEEMAFIIARLLGYEDKSPYWLGGYQDDDASEPTGAWQWVTGEAWGYSNWANGEPNNLTWSNEDSLAFAFWRDASVGQWNDAPTNYMYRRGGYIIEYAEYAVPGPGTLALFGLGLVGIALSRRRRNA